MKLFSLVPLFLLAACTARPLVDGREGPDNPEAAHRWRMLAWKDELGRLPKPDDLERALAQRREVLLRAAMDGGGKAGISPGAWTARGPANVGGRTRCLVIDPRNPKRLITGCVSGGIWTSDDGGLHWKTNTDWLPSLAICCMAMDPADPNVIYAGTGEGYFNGDAVGGAGIYVSRDNGRTWKVLPSTSKWDNVCRISISPKNGRIILAGKRYGGIFLSTDGGATWSNRRWAQGCFDVDFDPNDPSKAVASLIDYKSSLGGWYHHVVYSTDGGRTWVESSGMGKMTGFGSRIEVAYAPSKPGMVYASCASGGGKIWRSTDGGKTFTLRTGSSYKSGANWYADPLWVDPTNENFLLTGGVYVYKSTDGGKTLVRIGKGYILTQRPHPDIHFFTCEAGFNGTTNKRVYVTTDGAVHRTDDIYSASASGGWVSLYRTYETTQFYGAAGDGPTGLLVGGTQDNGTLCLKNEAVRDAVMTFGGDGGFCAVYAPDPSFLFGEYIRLKIHRSTNGGRSARYIYHGIADAGTNANFIAPFILDPNRPAVLLAGGASLWRTENALASTVSWIRIMAAGKSRISAIAVAPGDSDIVWVGKNNGELWKTSNGKSSSPTWTAVDDNWSLNPLPNRYVTRILIDRRNHSKVYVCLGGFKGDNLQVTTDGGKTFRDATGTPPAGLPDVPVRGIAQHPYFSDWLYAATEVGVFASEDGGKTWSTTNDGPADVCVDEVVFLHHSTTLLAATHGRGLFTAKITAVKGSFQTFGTGCKGSKGVPGLALDPSTEPVIGGKFKVRILNLPPWQFGWMVIGASASQAGPVPLPLDLGPLGMPGCKLFVSPDFMVYSFSNPVKNEWEAKVPENPVLLGSSLYLQYLSRDPGANPRGLTLSDAAKVTLGG